MGGSAGLFVLIVLAYYILSKKMQKSEYKKIQKLQQGTKTNSFSTEILFQKLYLFYRKIPFLKRYILKLRRKLEIINIQDEYSTRRDAAKIITKSLVILLPIVILTILLTKTNYLLMFILLIFELFMVDILIDSSVDKKDDALLVQQIDFFSEIRHAYHEYNMVEEAIYQVSQDDEKEISRQGEKIYEILTSAETVTRRNPRFCRPRTMPSTASTVDAWMSCTRMIDPGLAPLTAREITVETPGLRQSLVSTSQRIVL